MSTKKVIVLKKWDKFGVYFESKDGSLIIQHRDYPVDDDREWCIIKPCNVFGGKLYEAYRVPENQVIEICGKKKVLQGFKMW